MPPFIIEASLGLALVTSIVRLTSTVNRIEAKQDHNRIELTAKQDLIKAELDMLKTNYLDLKIELKEFRKFRSTDKS